MHHFHHEQDGGTLTGTHSVLVRVVFIIIIATKRHHDHNNTYKSKHLIEVAHLEFQRFCHQDWKHGSMQAYGVPELRVIHLDSEATGIHSLWGTFFSNHHTLLV